MSYQCGSFPLGRGLNTDYLYMTNSCLYHRKTGRENFITIYMDQRKRNIIIPF